MAACHVTHGENGAATTLEQSLAEVVSLVARRRKPEPSVDLNVMGGLTYAQCG